MRSIDRSDEKTEGLALLLKFDGTPGGFIFCVVE
jgi:hypothetical protein